MKQHRLPFALCVGIIAAALLALAAAPASAAAPMGKHFAVTLMMVNPESGEIDAAPACLTFSKGEMCTESDDCGTWEFIAKRGRHNEWIGTLEFVDGDTTVRAEIRGITERRAPGDSIGGTLVATLDGIELNAGFGGTRVSRAACLEFGLSDD